MSTYISIGQMTKSCVYRDLPHLPYVAYVDVLNNMVIYTGLLYVYAFMSLVYSITLHHKQLIDDGVSPQNIIYVPVETPIYNNILLEQLFSLAKQILSKEDSQEEFYVFFNEIQYLKDWKINLKSLVDTYHNVKFVVSGSAAALKKISSLLPAMHIR